MLRAITPQFSGFEFNVKKGAELSIPNLVGPVMRTG